MNKYFISILTIISLLFISCGEKQPKKNPPIKKEMSKKDKFLRSKSTKKARVLKKKKTRDELFPHKDVDRTKYPFAGFWEPSSNSYGALVFKLDNSFELYSEFDQQLKKDPKKKGTYKVIDGNLIELTVDGKTTQHKLSKLSSFVKIENVGVYFPPAGVRIKKIVKLIDDPKKILKLCQEANSGNIGKIYPYLSERSKTVLSSIGIISQTELDRHKLHTADINKSLRKFQGIESSKLLKEEKDKRVYLVTLKSAKRRITKEKRTLVKENNQWKCTKFDNSAFKPIRKFKHPAWFEDIAKIDTLPLFNSDEMKKVYGDKTSLSLSKKNIDLFIVKGKQQEHYTGSISPMSSITNKFYIYFKGSLNKKRIPPKLFKFEYYVGQSKLIIKYGKNNEVHFSTTKPIEEKKK